MAPTGGTASKSARICPARPAPLSCARTVHIACLDATALVQPRRSARSANKPDNTHYPGPDQPGGAENAPLCRDHPPVPMSSSPLRFFRDSSPAGAPGRKRSAFTYRHLAQMTNYATACPLRVIAHIDLDCFYAQVEMVRLSIPDDKPLAVQQWYDDFTRHWLRKPT